MTAAPLNQVELRGVSHRYGRRLALDDVTLTLRRGMVGLLGPNGAGKSTLMKVLATGLALQQGEVKFGDVDLRSDPATVRRLIGYLPQRFEIMGLSSVLHNVEYAAWAQGLGTAEARPAALRVLEQLGLADRAKSLARSLSGGMRQRLGIACALVHRPQVLILDEPTVGLDPEQRRTLRRTIAELARDSVVLLSTHLVEDLSRSASQVVVMYEGRIRFDGTVGELEARAGGDDVEFSSPLEAGYHRVLEAGTR